MSFFVKRCTYLGLFFLIGYVYAMDTRSNKWSRFISFVHDAQNKGVLDGEVLITQGGQIVLHAFSKEVEACYAKGETPLFMIGSIAKQFLAVALLKALYGISPTGTEDERAAWVIQRLQDPLSVFLPREDLLWGNCAPEWSSQVTLYHLLTHTSGIVDPTRSLFKKEKLDGVIRYYNTAHSLARIVQDSICEPLLFAPGSDFSYSNTGYGLLTAFIERITGQVFADFLYEAIIKPLRLRSTSHPRQGISTSLRKATHQNLMHEGLYKRSCRTTYALIKPPLSDLYTIANALGSGGIVSSVQDLGIWQRELHCHRSLLPDSLYQLFIKPHKNGYACGIFNRNGYIYHTGKIGSFTGCILYHPHEEWTLSMLGYSDYSEKDFIRLMDYLELGFQKSIPDSVERCEVVRAAVDDWFPCVRGIGRIVDFLFKNVLYEGIKNPESSPSNTFFFEVDPSLLSDKPEFHLDVYNGPFLHRSNG